jgi:hypothetical protein
VFIVDSIMPFEGANIKLKQVMENNLKNQQRLPHDMC